MQIKLYSKDIENVLKLNKQNQRFPSITSDPIAGYIVASGKLRQVLVLKAFAFYN